MTAHRLDPTLLARIANLTFRSRRLIEGSLTGSHRSPHRGASVEFAEHKEYSPGDNIRHIDWRVFAKCDKYYVKQFEEETNMRATFLLDASGSMAYASVSVSKFEFAANLVAAFAFILLRQQDAVGLVVASGDAVAGLRRTVPSRTRATHLRAILDLLGRVTPAGCGDLTAPVRELLEATRRRGLVVVVSDFLDQPPEIRLLLRQLRGRGHDVVLVHTLDEAELTLPFDGPLLMESLEDDRKVLVEPRQVRAAYRRELDAFIDGWRRWALESDIDYVVADTAHHVADTLIGFLLEREQVA